MLDRKSRYFVERVRRAKTVSIIVDEGSEDELCIKTSPLAGIRKLTHDLALAFQDYFNNRNTL